MDLVQLAAEFGAARGLDVQRLLEAEGLGPVGRAQAPRVKAQALGRLIEAIARSSGDACAGLHLGAWSGRLPASQLTLATAHHSRDLGDAVQRLVRYHALLSDALVPRWRADATHAALRLVTPQRLSRHQRDAAIAVLVTLLQRLSAQGVVLAVRLRGAAPVEAAEYRRVLRVPVDFEAEADEVLLARSALAERLSYADPELLPVLERQAEERLQRVEDTGWVGRARAVVRVTLLESARVPRLGEVARALAVSTRRLQAHLRTEGHSYRSVVDGVRRALAEGWLAQPKTSTSEVAYRLGFASLSAFTHAFRRWVGQSPRAFRARMKATP